MKGINKVTLIGHLGSDPEIRYFDSGVAKASFSLATSENYKNKKGEFVEKTEWHRVAAWRGLAEVVEKYLKKGSLIYLEGMMQTRTWDDKEGNTRWFTDVVMDKMVMLDRKASNGVGVPPSTDEVPKEELVAEEPSDDLPF